MGKKSLKGLKRTLSSTTSTSIEINSLKEGVDIYMLLTHARFFRSTLDRVEKVLCDSKINRANIYEIVLVGGSTCILRIVKLVNDIIERSKPMAAPNSFIGNIFKHVEAAAIFNSVNDIIERVKPAAISHSFNNTSKCTILNSFDNYIFKHVEPAAASNPVNNIFEHTKPAAAPNSFVSNICKHVEATPISNSVDNIFERVEATTISNPFFNDTSERTRHWGQGPMETGVYMLGTLQALAESSSNVLTRYISFTFHM